MTRVLVGNELGRSDCTGEGGGGVRSCKDGRLERARMGALNRQ